jgi:hypothetical protein
VHPRSAPCAASSRGVRDFAIRAFVLTSAGNSFNL